MPAVKREFLCGGQNGKISKQDEKIGNFLRSVTEIRAHGLQFSSGEANWNGRPIFVIHPKEAGTCDLNKIPCSKKYDE
jgi:hypothetical protein